MRVESGDTRRLDSIQVEVTTVMAGCSMRFRRGGKDIRPSTVERELHGQSPTAGIALYLAPNQGVFSASAVSSQAQESGLRPFVSSVARGDQTVQSSHNSLFRHAKLAHPATFDGLRLAVPDQA